MSGITCINTGDHAVASRCVDVVFTPSTGTCPVTVLLSTSTVNAHIFYTINTDASIDPTHSGDSATGGTIRIGSNSGSVNTGSAVEGSTRDIRAVAYEPTHLDSNITGASYDGKGGSGGG